MITLQFASHTDHITDDGQEYTQKPYPFHVDADGMIGRQDFWNGKATEVIGFVADPSRQAIDVWWRDVETDPSKAVGKYAVVADGFGKWATYVSAIESAERVTPDA